MSNPYPITPRQLDLVSLSGSHMAEQGVYPDIKMGVIASYNVSGGSTETVLKSTASGGLTLDSLNVQGNVILRNVLPENTDTYDLGSSINLWRKGWLSELDTIIFSENSTALVGGWLIIGKDQGSIPSFVDSTDTTIDFGKTMSVGGSVVFRSSLQVEYIGTGSLASGSTVYNVVRDLDGTGANDWVEGSAFLALGESGDGRIELNAYDTPRIQMIQQGETYNDQKEIIRIGDLNGNWNYSSEEWGVAIGSYGSGSANVTIDSDNGVRINIYDTPIMEFKSTGAFISNVLSISGVDSALSIGNPAPTSSTESGIWIDKTGMFAYNGTIGTQLFHIDNVNFTVGFMDDSLLIDYWGARFYGNPGAKGNVVAINWYLNSIGMQYGFLGGTHTTGYMGGKSHYGMEISGHSDNAGLVSTLNLMVVNTDSDRTAGIEISEFGVGGKLDGWMIPRSNMGSGHYTFTYVSASSFKITEDFTYSSDGDWTSVLTKGTKIKYTQNSVVKYSYVLSSSYNAGNDETTVVLVGDAVLDTATYAVNMTTFYYSHAVVADGFPGWFAYTPTASPSIGAWTTYFTTGKFMLIGKTCLFHANVTVTANGTGSGAVLLQYPLTPQELRQESFGGYGYNTGSGGIRWNLAAMIGFTAGHFTVYKYDGTYPVVDGTGIRLTGFYQIA